MMGRTLRASNFNLERTAIHDEAMLPPENNHFLRKMPSLFVSARKPGNDREPLFCSKKTHSEKLSNTFEIIHFSRGRRGLDTFKKRAGRFHFGSVFERTFSIFVRGVVRGGEGVKNLRN